VVRQSIQLPSTAQRRIFFLNDAATTDIYTLPYTTLFRSKRERRRRRRDAELLVRAQGTRRPGSGQRENRVDPRGVPDRPTPGARSEEHTSELQSRRDLVCRLLLEKKNNNGVRPISGVDYM